MERKLLAPLVAFVAALQIASAQQPQQPQQPTPPPGGQAGAPQGTQPQDQQPRPPVIRRGINFVRVDVIVTDGQGNPVLDLKPEDFEVFEDNAPQKVESFQVVKVAEQLAQAAEEPIAIRTMQDQEREVAREDVRIFAILLDDYHVRLGSSMAVREPLTKFIEQQVAPTDLIGLMYPLTPVTDFMLSRNKSSLVDAVRHFEGRKYNYEPRNDFEEKYAYYPASTVERIRNEVTLSALRALVTHLGGLREGRKAVILVSEGFTNVLPPSLNDPIAAMPGLGNPNRIGGGGIDPGADPRYQTQEFFEQVDIQSELREVYDAANRANTSIYTLDPRGLQPFAYDINEGVSTTQDNRLGNQMRDTLMVLASETDGRAIVNQNDLAAGLRQVVRDSSAYYLLGYNSTRAPNDGKFHEIKVRVKRRGVQVRARKGYWAFTADDVKRATASATATPPAPEYERALASMAAPKGRQIRTWIGTSRTLDGKTQLTFSWEPSPSVAGNPSNTAPARVSLIAISPSGQPLFRGAVPDGTAGTVQARGAQAISFDVPAGAVQLRYNIQNAAGGVLDSDSREITVPDYTKPEVQLSTARVLRARTVPEIRALKADPLAPPTASREFSRAERLLIRVQAYGPGGESPAVSAKLLNRTGKAMADVPIAAPAAPGGFYEADLPLSMLATGEYLIEITASVQGGGGAKDLIAIRVTS